MPSLGHRWHNARRLGVQMISSHIYREGNNCADKLASLDHTTIGKVWLDRLPPILSLDFFRDRCGFPTYRLPWSVDGLGCFAVFFYAFLFVFFEGLGIVPPPSVIIFFLFLIKLSWVWRYRMEISRGANLIGMSMKSLDAVPPSLFIKKKNHAFSPLFLIYL